MSSQDGLLPDSVEDHDSQFVPTTPIVHKRTSSKKKAARAKSGRHLDSTTDGAILEGSIADCAASECSPHVDSKKSGKAKRIRSKSTMLLGDLNHPSTATEEITSKVAKAKSGHSKDGVVARKSTTTKKSKATSAQDGVVARKSTTTRKSKGVGVLPPSDDWEMLAATRKGSEPPQYPDDRPLAVGVEPDDHDYGSEIPVGKMNSDFSCCHFPTESTRAPEHILGHMGSFAIDSESEALPDADDSSLPIGATRSSESTMPDMPLTLSYLKKDRNVLENRRRPTVIETQMTQTRRKWRSGKLPLNLSSIRRCTLSEFFDRRQSDVLLMNTIESCEVDSPAKHSSQSPPLEEEGLIAVMSQASLKSNKSNFAGHTGFNIPNTEMIASLLKRAETFRVRTVADLVKSLTCKLVDIMPDFEEELNYITHCLEMGPNIREMKCSIKNIVRHKSRGKKLEAISRKFLTNASRGCLQAVKIPDFGDRKSCPWLGDALPRCPCPIDELSKECIELVALKDFRHWNFNLFQLGNVARQQPLVHLGFAAFCRGNCFSEFPLNPKKCIDFLKQIEKQYHKEEDVPYHNSFHAADVVQTVHCMIEDLGMSIFFDPMDVLGLIFSACIHDTGHDGKNNAFHIKLMDDLAVTYNDTSALENYHVATGFRTLWSKGSIYNFVDNLSPDQATVLRKETVDMVLSTDMTYHFDHIKDFEPLLLKKQAHPHKWHEDEAGINSLRCMVLHSCDLANPAKPALVATMWSKRLIREWIRQGESEKHLGLPISPMCDRKLLNVSNSQTGFIDYVVLPTLRHLVRISPMINVCEDGCLKMLRTWHDRKDWTVDDLLPE